MKNLTIGGDFGFISFDAAVLGSYKSDAEYITDYGHFTITVPLDDGNAFDYSYQTFTGESLHYSLMNLTIYNRIWC